MKHVRCPLVIAYADAFGTDLADPPAARCEKASGFAGCWVQGLGLGFGTGIAEVHYMEILCVSSSFHPPDRSCGFVEVLAAVFRYPADWNFRAS